MPNRGELPTPMTRANTAVRNGQSGPDGEAWMIVAFCAIGWLMTMYFCSGDRRHRHCTKADVANSVGLERNRFRLNRLRSITYCWSMIFSENRCPLFRIMLSSRAV